VLVRKRLVEPVRLSISRGIEQKRILEIMPAISAQTSRSALRAPTLLTAQRQSKIVFAAVEHGAGWAIDDEASIDALVLRQDAREPTRDFAQRASRELMRLSGLPVRRDSLALLSLAAGISAEQVAARCAIAAALLRCFAQSDIVVMLACDAQASRGERAHAMALAEGLSEGRLGRSVLVRFSNVSYSRHGADRT
jgi:hypothetical protein